MKRALPLAAIVALLAAFFAFGLDRYLTFETLRENRAALHDLVVAHPFAAGFAFAASYVVVVAISLPGAAVMTTAGGALFGLWLGASLSIVGATIGATILFVAARGALAGTLRARAGAFVRRMEEGFNRNAFSYLLFLRLVPVFPFWAVNLVAAILGMELRAFVAATAIGIVPGALAFAAIGSGLDIIAGQSGAAEGSMPESIALRASLALLALVPIAVRWWRGRQRDKEKAGR